MKVPLAGVRLPYRRGSVEYSLGSEADHEAVYQTLLHVFHGPDRDSFLGALADPSYRPEQRLLVKIDGRVASHIHLTERLVRYGSTSLPMNGVIVGRPRAARNTAGSGFAAMRPHPPGGHPGRRERETVLQALTTGMPQFYRPLGWGVCGRQSIAQALSRNLPSMGDGLVEAKGGPWHVRPWRQVEINDLMGLYDRQYADTTGSVVRSEDYWRWIIGRRYAHVIWVACQGETVRGYAFVKDYKILEVATDPNYPQALLAILGRVRAEALERAYPEVIAYAPADHPVVDAFRKASGRVTDAEEFELDLDVPHPRRRPVPRQGPARADPSGRTSRAGRSSWG